MPNSDYSQESQESERESRQSHDTLGYQDNLAPVELIRDQASQKGKYQRRPKSDQPDICQSDWFIRLISVLPGVQPG